MARLSPPRPEGLNHGPFTQDGAKRRPPSSAVGTGPRLPIGRGSLGRSSPPRFLFWPLGPVRNWCRLSPSSLKRGFAGQGRRGFPAEVEGLAAKPSPCTIELSESPPLGDGWPLAAYPCAGRRGSQSRVGTPTPAEGTGALCSIVAATPIKGFR